MSPNDQPPRCPRCGANLPPSLPAGLCPKCLLEAGLGTQPQRGPGDTVILPEPPPLKGIPQPGEDFGHYRLVRVLGQGGMGVVFEAEDLETGRRVALKILSQALDSPEARKRFLREGQIAASINHPNSVYVFGTEEIAGTPVISMELLGGGTLRDRVAASGPLSAAEAVDAVLQIIAGLEAAQQAGVLHRDIKPSNCFTDTDGTIKIGDFGLSISTAVRTESNLTEAGSLFGTPAFSPPEQLRGEELTVRSDIYSVGVTLYYLLTGRMPFEAANVVQLLATVLEARPESPARLRPGIPNGLARAVLHCLNKDPGARFGDYAALRRALLPYASSSPTPATLALRFAAWIVDRLILSVPGLVFFLVFFGGFDAVAGPGQKERMLFSSVFSLLTLVSYFGLFEGLRGASPGKMLCRLRVIGLDGNPPGLRRAFLRALIYCAFTELPGAAVACFGTDWLMRHAASPATSLIWCIPAAFQLLIFCSCRRQNGFAGLHDLWSQTRVLTRPAQPVRIGLAPERETPPATGELSRIGPYHVLAELGQSGDATILLGYDTRLLRKVWLRRVPATAAAVEPVLRQLARPGRFRWLNGKRSGEDSWDAYEAAAGRSLPDLISTGQDWEKIRFWLLDLAEELNAGEKNGSLPPVLELDRVWITADGRAKLLDFPAPGTSPTGAPASPGPATPQEFLRQTAVSALEGRPMRVEETRASNLEMPLPLYARDFFQRIQSEPDAARVCARLKPLTLKVASITRRRRWALLALSLAFPLFIFATQMMGRYLMRNSNSVELVTLQRVLTQVNLPEMDDTASKSRSRKGDKMNRELEIYIASRFRPLVTNSVEWNGLTARIFIQPPQRVLAEHIVAAHPGVTEQEFAEVKTAVESRFHIPPPVVQSSDPISGMSFPPFITYVSTLMFVVAPCFAAALLFRGGLAMRVLGIAVVGRNGRPSRLRILWRNLIAWLPFLLSPMLLKAAEDGIGRQWALPVVAALLALLAGVSLSLRRSLQDRLAGAWLVPDGATPEPAPAPAGNNPTR